MPDFELPHLDISNRRQANHYKAPSRNMGGGSAPRVREQHGAMLLAQLKAAFQEVADAPPPDEDFERSDGAYYEIQLRKGSDPEALDRKTAGMFTGAIKRNKDDETVATVLFIPDDSIAVVETILEDYRAGPLSEKGRPPKKGFVEPIEEIRRARLFDFWTDKPAALPDDPQTQIWWEIWCIRGMEGGVVDTLAKMECQIAADDYRLIFPESVVIPVFARRADIEVALFACKGITELRRGSDTPSFFMEEERENQHDWAADLADRTVWPGANVTRVCLLDTGVNRAHVLIEPALAEDDLLTANPDGWRPTIRSTATAPRWQALPCMATCLLAFRMKANGHCHTGWNPFGSCPQTVSHRMNWRAWDQSRRAPLHSPKSKIRTSTASSVWRSQTRTFLASAAQAGAHQ